MRTWTARVLCAVFIGAVLSAQTVSAQDKPKIEHGMKVYAAQKCGVCHSIEGKGAKKGPLDGVGSKLTEDEIRQWIVNAPEMTEEDERDAQAGDEELRAPPKGGCRCAGRLHVEPQEELSRPRLARSCAVSFPAALRHPVALLGVAITTVMAVLFLRPPAAGFPRVLPQSLPRPAAVRRRFRRRSSWACC